MAITELYASLKEIVAAAERDDYDAVRELNREFSRLLRETFADRPAWNMDPDALRFDRCANSAVYAVLGAPDREDHLARMRERFRSILKPE